MFKFFRGCLGDENAVNTSKEDSASFCQNKILMSVKETLIFSSSLVSNWRGVFSGGEGMGARAKTAGGFMCKGQPERCPLKSGLCCRAFKEQALNF